MGGTEIVVAPDAEVDVDGLIILGATDENVRPYSGPKRQRIRVRSWGAMGGCEVRSAMPKQRPVPPQKASPMSMEHYRQPRQHEIGIRSGLVMLYKFFATVVGIACIVLFILSSSPFLDDEVGRTAAFFALFFCVYLWFSLGYFRRIIGAGPDDDDEETVKQYYSSSIIGSFIRMLAMLAGVACPTLLVVSGFFHRNDDELRLAALFCGMACVAMYFAASYVEEFFYGKMSE